MPPKKAAGPSKKTENKQKDKVIEDKTFGLKNKKGGKQQKFIAQVEKQVKSGGNPLTRKRDQELADERKRKEDAKKLETEKAALYKPVIEQQTVAFGTDPKSVFCAFFKQGLCKKGDKCKFSHDPDVERKSAKRNVYDAQTDKANDDMSGWDDDKLKDVVNQKHGSEKSNQTDIICKYFIEAVENNKYGWFWSCPNGGKACMYRHALPPDFILKKDAKKEDKVVETSLEELIEQKRAELSLKSDLTPINPQTFLLWKKRRLEEKKKKMKDEELSKRGRFVQGETNIISGKDIFASKLFTSDESSGNGAEEDTFDIAGMRKSKRDDNDGDDFEDETPIHEIKFDEFGILTSEMEMKKPSTNAYDIEKSGQQNGSVATYVIDEHLFQDEDLDELEEDIGKLTV